MESLDYSTYSSEEVLEHLGEIIYDILGNNREYNAQKAFDRVVSDYWVNDNGVITIRCKNLMEFELRPQLIYTSNDVDKLHALKEQFEAGELVDVDLPELRRLAKKYENTEADLLAEVEEKIHELKHEEEEE